MNENQQDNSAAFPTDNSGPFGIQQEATCGMCAFLVTMVIKGGPANLGQQMEKTECRRFPPAVIPVLALPIDAIRAAGGPPSPILGVQGGPQMRQQQMAILQPAGGAPAYPPVPPHFPACGEFTPRPELLGGGAGFVDPETQGGHENPA